MVSSNTNISSSSVIKYTLKVPLKHGNEIIKELVITRPKLKHLRTMDDATGDIDRVAKLLVVLCNLPPPVLDEMDSTDFSALGDIITDFFPKPPKISSDVKPH